jgi:hypothetical protein
VLLVFGAPGARPDNPITGQIVIRRSA